MQKIQLIFILLFCSVTASAIGMSDWQENTPGGNSINNFSGKELYLNNYSRLENLSEWYFYKGYIIGIQGNFRHAPDSISYFAVNEKTFEIHTFATKEEWNFFLEQHQLNPRLITRWYSGDWTIFNDSFYLLFMVPVILPVAILFILLLYNAIRKEKFDLRKPFTIASIVIAILAIIIWLADRFPQSI